MNITGYMVIISSLQQLSRHKDSIKDISLQVNTLSNLADQLKNNMAYPLEDYRNNSMQRKGNLSIYISQNLRSYIFERQGLGSDEGFILKMLHSPYDGKEEKYHSLAYFIHDKSLSYEQKKLVYDKFQQYSKEQKKSGLIIDNVKTIIIN